MVVKALETITLARVNDGEKGERGKQIFKSSYEDVPNSSTNYWSDLSPAVSVDNPPKIGDTVITPSGNIFQINAVTVGGGGGGGVFGVGNVLGNIKGPQGPQGVPGSQDVPMTYVQTAQPSGTIVKDSIWWVGATMSSVTALKRWNGSSWIPETIAQDVLNVVSLNAVDITGSTISGSKFVSSFSGVKPDGVAEYTVNGTTQISDGTIVTDTYSDTDNTHITNVAMDQFGFTSNGYNKGTLMASTRISTRNFLIVPRPIKCLITTCHGSKRQKAQSLRLMLKVGRQTLKPYCMRWTG